MLRSKRFGVTLIIMALVGLVLALATSGNAKAASTVPASKAFDTCFSCFGQAPTQAWFSAEKAAGYELFITDPETWNSEFPNGNTDDPAPGSACRVDSSELQDINHAVYAGMKVALYNRDLNCYQATLSALGPKERKGVSVYIWDVEQSPALVPTAAEEAQVTKDGFLNAVYTWDGATNKSIPGSGPNMPLHFNEVSDWNGCSGNTCGVPSGFPSMNAIPHFDGWTSADIEQQSTGNLNGMNVDYDSASTAWVKSLRTYP